MKKSLLIFTAILLICATVLPLASCDGKDSEKFAYTLLSDGTYGVCGIVLNCEEVIIPETYKGIKVTTILEFAFSDFENLKSVTIPNSITNISDNAFEDCTSLESVTLPDSITSIGYHAFMNCTSLKSITIPDSVTSIYSFSFSGCTSLESITIPNSIENIGVEAFHNCTNLKTVYYSGSEDDWSQITFSAGNGDLTEATIVYNYASK